jgi:hypothetical protein
MCRFSHDATSFATSFPLSALVSDDLREQCCARTQFENIRKAEDFFRRFALNR